MHLVERCVQLRSGYSDIDQTGEAPKYAERLEAVGASPFWRDVRQRMTDLLELEPGQSLLDVGCGTGDELRRLAHLIAPAGYALGVDKSAGMVDEAKRRTWEVPVPIEFKRGDAQALEFDNGQFDACRAERVLQHLVEPYRAVNEILRVVRPGGHAVFVEPDYGTLAIAGADPEVTARILNTRRQHFASPRIGGQIHGLLKARGARDVVVQVRVFGSSVLYPNEHLAIEKYAGEAALEGSISDTERQIWLDQLEEAASEGRYRHAVFVYVVSARKA